MLAIIILWFIALVFWLYFAIRAIICLVRDNFENPWVIPMWISVLCMNLLVLIMKVAR